MKSPVETSTKTFDRLYKELNGEQKKAVDMIEGPVLLLAGPGTGKTQVLAMRIAKILRETQMDPWNILCLTFTESGAQAMRMRLVKIIGQAAYAVRIHTFHSFCREVISESPEIFHQAREWEVLSDVERVEIFRELIDERPGTSSLKPFGDTYLYLKDLISGIQVLKREDITPDKYGEILGKVKDFLGASEEILNDWFKLKPKDRTEDICVGVKNELAMVAMRLKVSDSLWVPIEKVFENHENRVGDAVDNRALSSGRTKLKNDVKRWYERSSRYLPRQIELKNVYERYQRELKKRGRFDFEDMIMSVVEQFKVYDELLARYQEQFQYVLVDEYQDTNGAQNEALNLIGSFSEAPNIFVVGDDKQSIYRFQGASMENLRYFYDLYKDDIAIISLEKNYRSQSMILQAAGEVISKNNESIDKYVKGISVDLLAKSKWPARAIVQVEADSEEGERLWVGNKIKRLLADGVRPEDIVVLVRYHKDGLSFYEELMEQALPVVLEAQENALQDSSMRQWLKLVEWLVSSNVDLLPEIIQYQWLGIGEVEVLKILHGARMPIDVLEKLPEDLVDKLAKWKRESVNKPLDRWLADLAHDSGWVEHVLQDKYSWLRLKSLRSVLDFTRQMVTKDKNAKGEDFMRQIRVMRENNLSLSGGFLGVSGEKVRIMTAHKAKGLEFDYVFIVGLNDKHWGNVSSRERLPLPAGVVKHDVVGGQENNEDERRLFYVAMSRARKQLYLTRGKVGSDGREKVPAVFWQEISDKLLKKVEYKMTEDDLKGRMVERKVVKQDSEELHDWLRGLLENYAMSVTHLNNYLECPRLFYYRNLLRVPQAKNKNMALGTAVHKALRDWLVQYKEGERLPTGAWLVDRFALALDKESLSEQERKDSLSLGQEALLAYWNEVQGKIKGDVLLEYDFKAHGVVIDGLKLVGVLDKVEINDQEVRVVDYKTGNPDSVGASIKEGGNYWRQLVFYKLLCDESDKFKYEMVSGAVDFIQLSKRTGKRVVSEVVVSKDDVSSLKDEIMRVWGEIRDLKFLDEQNSCGKCEHCQNLRAR